MATADDVDVDAIKATKHNVLRGVNFFKAIAEGEYVAGEFCDATSCNPYWKARSCGNGNNPNDTSPCGPPCERQKNGCESAKNCVNCDDWGSDGYYCEYPPVQSI